jgi:F-type H+-transporting ATPase subunit epsilon
MAETIKLEIVTPERMVVSTDAEDVQIPGKSGYLGILPGHAPLLTEIDIGEIAYHAEGELKRLAVAWGFAEILPDKVTILAETAEKAEEINVPRAQTAKQKAEGELQKAGVEGNADAQAALKRADTRIDVAGRQKE